MVDAVEDINEAYLIFYAKEDDPSKVEGPCGEKLNIQAISRGVLIKLWRGSRNEKYKAILYNIFYYGISYRMRAEKRSFKNDRRRNLMGKTIKCQYVLCRG